MEFSKVGDAWEAQYTSAGKTFVEIERNENGVIKVYCKIPDANDYALLACSNMGANELFTIDVPVGTLVKITSATEVIKATTEAYD